MRHGSVSLIACLVMIASTVLATAQTLMMAPASKTVTLNSGKAIPTVGLGVFLIRDGCVDVVRNALRIGYRHIDTAHYYNNEREIGRAVRDSGVPCEEIFVTSKLWLSQFGHSAAKRVRLQSLGIAALSERLHMMDDDRPATTERSISTLCRGSKTVSRSWGCPRWTSCSCMRQAIQVRSTHHAVPNTGAVSLC